MIKNIQEKREIEENLKNFCGTTTYYKYLCNTSLTDGTKYLAEACGAFWLMDIIASYQQKFSHCLFQIWELKITSRPKAVVTMKEDTDSPILAKQEIEYTDFPLDEIKMYCENRVIFLPSEY